MLTAAELTGMRSTSTSALPDACTITEDARSGTLNTSTGVWVPGSRAPVYVGVCRLRPVDAQEQDTEVGDLHETLGRYVVTLPYTATGVEVDHVVTITTSDDADLVGRTFRVKHVGWSSHQIDRRLIVEDREQPSQR